MSTTTTNLGLTKPAVGENYGVSILNTNADLIDAGVVLKAPLTTKGDIYVASGASTPIRLAVGADGYVLVADSGETAGVKWGALLTAGTWTPVLTSATGTITSYTVDQAAYRVIDDEVFISLKITVTDVGTGGGAAFITLPFTASGDHMMCGRENGVSGKALQGYASSTSLVVWHYDNSNPLSTGAVLIVSGTYIKST